MRRIKLKNEILELGEEGRIELKPQNPQKADLDLLMNIYTKFQLPSLI